LRWREGGGEGGREGEDLGDESREVAQVGDELLLLVVDDVRADIIQERGGVRDHQAGHVLEALGVREEGREGG
jgi:hypothetical protein